MMGDFAENIANITEFSFSQKHGDGWCGSLLPLIVEGEPGIYGVIRLRDFDAALGGQDD